MRDDFKFRDILLQYSYILRTIKTRLDLKEISEEEAYHRCYSNMDWFHFIRLQLFERNEVYEEVYGKKLLNNKKFLLPEDQRCPGCDDGKPYKVIRYRGLEIPVYDDDYGQQDFAIIDGETVSGGCYNFFADEEFINFVDHKLEKEYLENKYDMHEEISKLFPEWKENK